MVEGLNLTWADMQYCRLFHDKLRIFHDKLHLLVEG